MTKLHTIALLFASALAASAADEKLNLPVANGPFRPDWESLKHYQCPEWFRDAKFGIWAHWGPQSVTGAGDWYARQMYIEGHAQYNFHLTNYGHPSVFGYKDIVPLWKAEKFDPERLMEKYQKAGAKYFVSMGVHHDNFDLWNSKYHAWNAVQKGPRKDIVGLWAAAARKYGLRFGVSEHLERSYSWFNTNKGADKKGPKAGVPYDGNDPKFAEFYFPPHDDNSRVYPLNPPAWWEKQWFDRIQDLVDQYQPDLLYTDGGIPFGEVGRSLVAHFYNQNIRQHQGKLEAVYTIKDIPDKPILRHGDYVEGVAVQDLERKVLKGIKATPWQTDTSIGDWFHRDNDKYKTPAEVIHLLADIVSKNGNLLINFTQRPDGTLDEANELVLDQLARWMPAHGEAIFGTRPWLVYGEGPNVARDTAKFSAADFRFTTKGRTLYAIALGWPADGKLVVHSLAKPAGKLTSVALLGYSGKIDWQQTGEGLVAHLPKEKVSEYTAILKIQGADLKPASPNPTSKLAAPANSATSASVLEGGSPELLPGANQATSSRKAPPAEPDAEIQARVRAWKAATFGLFIHWGAYSQAAGEWNGRPIAGNGEWIQYRANVPNDEYAAAAKAFNPVKFNAEEWVALAKTAGMKYIVITAKHHDGFALFPSQYSDFTLQKVTPFKRDPIKELATAARKAGLGFGLYYSNDLDWHRGMWNNNDGKDLAQKNVFIESYPGRSMGPDLGRLDPAKFDDYYRHTAMPQVRELLTNYGPLLSLFFDGNPIASTVEQGLAMRSMIRQLQPTVVINNRLRSVRGDYFVCEQHLPPQADPGIWEGCMTMNGTWGFKKQDTHWKSTPELIFTLVDAVSKGGNFLLNVGPTGEGLIPEASITRLKEMGDWLKVNGEAIYGASRTVFGAEFGTFEAAPKDKQGKPPFKAKRDWRCTAKPGRLYVHVFNSPAGKLELPPLKSKITKASFLADPKRTPLKVSQNDRGLSLELPAKAPHALASVICLEVVE